MKKTFAYILYIVTVTLIFLYYLFPSAAVKTYMSHHVSLLWPQFQLTAEKIVPTAPPGLKLELPVLSRNQKVIAGADYLKVIPAWLSLFSAEKKILIRGNAYDGALSGTVLLSELNTAPVLDLDMVFGGIQIGRIPGISAFITHEIKGEAAGKILYSGVGSPAGQGRLEITATDCLLSLNPPFLEVQELSFNSIDAEAELVDRRIRISRFNVKGREVNLNATGTIVLRDPIDTSALNIEGRILPHPSFIRHLSDKVPAGLISEKTISGGGIPFRISGTVAHPGFSLQ
jgi:type II secretion system protein N